MNIPPQVLVDPAFARCLHEAASNPQLVAQYDRLNGTTLGRAGSPGTIDTASARLAADVRGLAEFVYDAVYSRVGSDVLQQLRAQVAP